MHLVHGRLLTRFAVLKANTSSVIRQGMFASKDGLAGARHGELASRPRVRVRAAFKEEAPELAVRAALEKVKAAIVDGPSVAGFYLLDVSIDGQGIGSADGAVRALRGCGEVIRFAEIAAQ